MLFMVQCTIITDHFSLRPTVACEWEWNELLSCRVTPPFIPKIVSATLISYTTELNLVTACNIHTKCVYYVNAVYKQFCHMNEAIYM